MHAVSKVLPFKRAFIIFICNVPSLLLLVVENITTFIIPIRTESPVTLDNSHKSLINLHCELDI